MPIPKSLLAGGVAATLAVGAGAVIAHEFIDNPSSAVGSQTTASASPGDPVGRVAADSTARVIGVETGVVRLKVRGRTLRASYGGALLAAIAQDAEAAPRVGDRVQVRRWADGCSTVERVVVRAVPDEPS